MFHLFLLILVVLLAACQGATLTCTTTTFRSNADRLGLGYSIASDKISQLVFPFENAYPRTFGSGFNSHLHIDGTVSTPTFQIGQAMSASIRVSNQRSKSTAIDSSSLPFVCIGGLVSFNDDAVDVIVDKAQVAGKKAGIDAGTFAYKWSTFLSNLELVLTIACTCA